MIEPARAAFLLIDMQNGFIDAASPLCIAGAAATVPACAHALAAAREHGLAVFHVRRAYAADGSDVEAVRWETWAEGGRPLSAADPASLDCPPELSPAPGEPVIMKPSWSAFFGTDLAALLRARGIGTLVLAGTTTPNCVRSTAYDGLALGFNVAVLRDATSSRSPEAQEANLADMEAVGIQLLHTDDFAANGLLHVRDTEAEVARAVALERATQEETEGAADKTNAVVGNPVAPLPPTPALESVETVSTGWINKYHLHYTLPDGAPLHLRGRFPQGDRALRGRLGGLREHRCARPRRRVHRAPSARWLGAAGARVPLPAEQLVRIAARRSSSTPAKRWKRPSPASFPRRPATACATTSSRRCARCPNPASRPRGLPRRTCRWSSPRWSRAASRAPDSAELIEPFTVARADLRAFLDANQLPIGTRCQLILELLAL